MVACFFCFTSSSSSNGHPELLVYVSFEKMMTSLETVAFQRGEVVFAEGQDVEESPYMYILGSGKVIPCVCEIVRFSSSGEGEVPSYPP